MIKHIVSWKFQPEVTEEQKKAVADDFEKRLLAVKEKATGVIDVKVIKVPLPTSSVELILDSSFVSTEALAAYQVHPDHVAAVAACVKPYLSDRTCCDYEVN